MRNAGLLNAQEVDSVSSMVLYMLLLAGSGKDKGKTKSFLEPYIKKRPSMKVGAFAKVCREFAA